MSLRIAFMGTPEFVVPTVKALNKSDHDLVCIYTQPPRQKGRNQKVEKTPVHKFAEESGIEVRHPENFKAVEDAVLFEDLALDIAVVAAYGMLLPESILKAPKYGCVNIHPSLLPRWRGPSPIQYAIWKGDSETGVSIMSLDKGMDSGPLLAQEKKAIKNKNFEQLNTELWQTGTKLLLDELDKTFKTKKLKTTLQNEEGVTYCKLLTKDQGKIDWTESAENIDRQIRGLNPWPGTWCLDKDSKRLKILSASLSSESTTEESGKILENGSIACSGGTILKLETIQPENKKLMDVQAAINGGHLKAGDVLS